MISQAKAAQWLRAVEFDSASPRVTAIASGATAAAKDARTFEIIGLVAIATGRHHDDIQSWLVDEIRAFDSDYVVCAADLGPRIVACLTLSEVLAYNDADSVFASHALLSARWQGYSPASVELLDEARAAMNTVSQLRRSRTVVVPKSKFVAPDLHLPAMTTPMNYPGTVTSEQFAGFVTGVTSAFSAFSQMLNDTHLASDARAAATDEELNILWWLVRGRSETTGQDWVKIRPPIAAALAAGLELANMVLQDAPAPASVRYLLRKILAKNAGDVKPLSTACFQSSKVITGASPAPDERAEGLLPILNGLRLASAASSENQLAEALRGQGINGASQHDHESFAVQMLREILIQRTVRGRK